MQPTTEKAVEPSQRRDTQTKGPSVKAFLILWLLFIALGITATYLYSNHLKQQVVLQVQSHTDSQLASLKDDYEQKLDGMSKEMAELQSKVDSFNELLTFTKDNASSKTDNSNKLYTQLSEVQEQLDKLEKQMDLLK
ncbi:hypothetical protein OIN60_01840 [Paenibacillus sp. P96]|uniref:Uncharacterized protein n=1 Tax=Paenibacillus zeirhizosphaerae TaxID=2987519 RepID=A0ABT9FLC1_9BACL|nr:hypothetical protein [Paenibacillus sp. P96]MDP4095534.1 hypothetical protein [Paenibacillus sp. P96]